LGIRQGEKLSYGEHFQGSIWVKEAVHPNPEGVF